ncbi:FUSC family protein [Ancylobacter sp. Lp-2]|uniref:FUSC family protein n=1 Tax=Ancylobacter sp. Lp-2 TaxID=2881339 RepID=UPI001E5905FF|nr:FUSC family protein [Ancylobacter sp. Lp-2]MCB4767658.1 FUSC family protein [Ancylobacter sp. Lp-2]
MSDTYESRARDLHGPLTPFAALGSWVVRLNPRLLFGARLAASVCTALYITYFLELQNSFWAATTAAIVCQPNLGASLRKARFRVIGTIVGALVMVQLYAVFPQQRDILMLSLALWCGVCGFAVVMLRNFASYAAALAGITATIIFADSLTNPSNAFFLSVIRVGEIGIGIGAAGLVMLLTDFGTASRQLANTLQQTTEQLVGGFLETLMRADDTPELQAARRNLTRALGSLDTQVDATIGESSFFRSRTGNLQRMMATLVSALVAWRNVGNRLARHDGELSVTSIVVPLLQRVDVSLIRSDPRRLQRICREVVGEFRTIASTDSTSCLLVDASRDVAISLADLVDCIVLLSDREGDRLMGPAAPLVVADPLPAILNGVRVFSAVLVTCVFWVFTAWPNGSFAVVFAAIGTLVFGSFGDQARALAKDYAIGSALMAVLGGGLYFAILPSLSTFPALMTVLVMLFVPLGVLQAGKWHSVVFLAMSVVSLPLLGVGNPILYSAADYFNLVVAIVFGTVVGTMFFVVMPVPRPEIRARRLEALALRDFRRLAQGRWPHALATWTALLTRRIEALPPQATLEVAGNITALLALGQAVIYLRQAIPRGPAGTSLSQALVELAESRLATARETLIATSRLADHPPPPTTNDETVRPARLRAALAVITDAIDSHPALLSEPVEPLDLLLLSFT